MQVREAMGEYLAAKKRLEPLTRLGYSQKLSVFCDWCEEHQLELETIRARNVEDFLEHLKHSRTSRKTNRQNISSYTLAGYIRVIKGFLNWCILDGEYEELVKSIVVRRMKLPRIEQTVIETFSSEQIDALFAACAKEETEHLQLRDRAILALLLDTGIRAAELCGLTLDQVQLDPKDSYIRVHGKRDKWREVGLGDRTRRELRKYIRIFRAETARNAPLFIGRYHRPLTVSGLDQIISRLAEWAHIEGVRCSPHTFRHTFACNYLLQGGDIYALSRLMGHTSIRVTEVYLRAIKAREARQTSKSVLDSMKG